MASGSTAAWHPDPYGRYEFRFWDGEAWTENVSTQGVTAVDPLSPTPPAGVTTPSWQRDPFGRFESRYWDGSRWTDHVATAGVTALDPPVHKPLVSHGLSIPGVHAPIPSVYTESRFLVSQKARLMGRNANFSLTAPDGRPLGEVREVGRGAMRKLVDQRPDETRTYKLEVTDAQGQLLLAMVRPATWGKSRMSIDGPGGQRIGYVVHDRSSFVGGVASAVQSARSALGRSTIGTTGDDRGPTYARFRLEAMGQVVGRIYAEDVDAWNFRIVDAQDQELARITKEWAGWVKERFTRADHYAVEVFASLQDPLRSLVIASAVAVDLALKQGH